jgi:DNA-directed RNA polymerase specialized sigma24 family protein
MTWMRSLQERGSYWARTSCTISAHNAGVDALRREQRSTALGDADELDGLARAAHEPERAPTFAVDDELRLLFLCCHPELPAAGRLALALNGAFGLGAGRIARIFISDERTLAQRIVRAKHRRARWTSRSKSRGATSSGCGSRRCSTCCIWCSPRVTHPWSLKSGARSLIELESKTRSATARRVG